MTPEEERSTAHHEAGHAVAAFMLRIPVEAVRLLDGGGGECLTAFQGAGEDLVVVALAGPMADLRVFEGHCPAGWLDQCDGDVATAGALLKLMHRNDVEVFLDRAADLLEAHWSDVEKIANALRKTRQELNASTILSLLKTQQNDNPDCGLSAGKEQ